MTFNSTRPTSDLTPLLLRLAFWCALGTVTVLSLLPGAYLPPVAFDVWDKAQHTLGFLMLGLLGLWFYASASKHIVWGLLVYGALIELIQAATGWRYGDWQDWMANAIGISLAYGLWLGFCQRVISNKLVKRKKDISNF